ncbi:MAG: cupin domain-containing protein [Candidatus Sulfotelmatobacter sp.]
MATVRLPDEGRTLRDRAEITTYLANIGIEYERWEPEHAIEPGATSEEVLATYSGQIEKLKRRGGYVVADVIDVNPEIPNLEAMLARFSREHWHDEDEVRFILQGRGVFHIRRLPSPTAAIEVEAGDLIRVPRGTWHWFDLCAERRIRAIRLFQDAAGWTPHYTNSGVDQNYQPVCLGPSDIPHRTIVAEP